MKVKDQTVVMNYKYIYCFFPLNVYSSEGSRKRGKNGCNEIHPIKYLKSKDILSQKNKKKTI